MIYDTISARHYYKKGRDAWRRSHFFHHSLMRAKSRMAYLMIDDDWRSKEERFFTNDKLSGLQFKIYRMTKFHQPYHAHEYFQMWYVKNGTCTHFIEDERYELKKGDVIILPIGVYHRLNSESCRDLIMIGCEFINGIIFNDISMPLESFVSLLKKSDGKMIYSLDGIDLRNAENMFEEMEFEYGHRRINFEFQIKADILKILTILTRKSNDESMRKANMVAKHQKIILNAIDYINLNYRRKINLQEICDVTMMSATHFTCLFKEATGRTLVDYVNNLRIQNAVELLCDNSLSIKQISIEVGFKDPAYFSRIFTKRKGSSPEKYRENITNSNQNH